MRLQSRPAAAVGWRWMVNYTLSVSRMFVEGPLAGSKALNHSAMGPHKLVCFWLPCTLCLLDGSSPEKKDLKLKTR